MTYFTNLSKEQNRFTRREDRTSSANPFSKTSNSFYAPLLTGFDGHSEKGRELSFTLQKTDEVGSRYIERFWKNAEAKDHNFHWISDLSAYGGELERYHIRQLIGQWVIEHGLKKNKTWTWSTMGPRLYNWLQYWAFYGDTAPPRFAEVVYSSILMQASALLKIYHLDGQRPLHSLRSLAALSIIATSNLQTSKIHRERLEHWIENWCQTMLYSDGMMKTRSFTDTVDVLKLFNNIVKSYKIREITTPDFFDRTLDRLYSVFQFARLTDKRLAIAHRGWEGEEPKLSHLAHATPSKSSAKKSLEGAGFERLSQGRTTIIFDRGIIPPKPFDRTVHASPLTFNMSYGKDRFLSSCGHHGNNTAWNSMLRNTAAHNGLTLNNSNAVEIRNDSHMGKAPSLLKCEREQSKGSILLKAQHNGYAGRYSMIHKRQLYLSDKGCDLRGEDLLDPEKDGKYPDEPLPFAIRFHLYPRVKVSLVADGKEALMRLPSGVGWRFQHIGGLLALEDSIYLGQENVTQKTEQLVIHAETIEGITSIKWSFKLERF